MSDKKDKLKAQELEKTVIKSLGQCSFSLNADPSAIDVKDGRILRIRPYHYDEKYTREEINPWKIEKNGKVLEPSMKAAVAPYMIAYKKRVYSPNRIRYPLKRVDWDPDGERNPQNRGKSKFKRISWDEATTIIANEIKRMKEQYGPYAVLCHGDGHGGLMTPAYNLLNDVTQNTEMLIHIGADLETTPWGFGSQFPSQVLYFWSSIVRNRFSSALTSTIRPRFTLISGFQYCPTPMPPREA